MQQQKLLSEEELLKIKEKFLEDADFSLEEALRKHVIMLDLIIKSFKYHNLRYLGGYI